MQIENQSMGSSSSYEQPNEVTQTSRDDQPYPGGAFGRYPSGPSQPLYGQPSPYSQPIGQPGPYSQPMGMPGGPSVSTMAPPRPKRSLKRLWVTLAIVGVLALLSGGGGVFAFSLYGAPGAAVSQFCGHLKGQNYDSAYTMLSARLKGQYTADQFRAATTQLDAAEGRVTACSQSSGNGAYDYRLGGNAAMVLATLTRERQGSLQGGLHLVNETGGWKVDALDTSLLGAHLGALGAINAFCAALRNQSYTVAFGLLGSALQSALKQDDFVAQAQIHDKVDGVVTTCALDAVTPASNTDTAAEVRVAVARSKLGAVTGAVSVAIENGSWKLSQISPQVQGSDLEPLLTGMRFCTFVVAGAYEQAYALLSSAVQRDITLDSFRSADYFGNPSDYKYLSCTPNLDTYKVSTAGGPYDSTVKVQRISTGSTVTFTLTLYMRPYPEGWRINGWQFNGE